MPRDGEYCRLSFGGAYRGLVREEGASEEDAPVATDWRILSSEIDRHGTDIQPRVLDIEGYNERNPVVFANHLSRNEFPPIANSRITLSSDAKRLNSRIREEDWNLTFDMARTWHDSAIAGKVHGASIGFVGAWERVLKEEGLDPKEWSSYRLRLKEGEVVEWSLAGVPSDPGAVRTERMLFGTGETIPDIRTVHPVTVDVSQLERQIVEAVAASVTTAFHTLTLKQ